jgi:glycosyltransferase involved in cell wall biosynthesis
MSARPIAFVMEQTLGNITHYLNLRREETASPLALPRWIPVAFRNSRMPWALSGSMLTRRALAPALAEVDGIFVHTSTIALLCRDFFSKKPTVLSSDGTPIDKRGMRAAYGLKPDNRLAEAAKHSYYRGVFERAKGFVAWSHWTKRSLVRDYAMSEDKVAVIPPGVHLDEFVPGNRDHEVPRILFVGGDFQRKGGELLLQVFRRRFRGLAELIIVTRDPVPEEAGVTVHRNVAANSPQLRELYATSDIFALPSRADCYSLVCLEALAAGLPLVATRVGGIPDVVREGETGFLMEPDDATALGDAIEYLVADRGRRAAMGIECRRDAGLRFEARTNARRLFEFVRERC